MKRTLALLVVALLWWPAPAGSRDAAAPTPEFIRLLARNQQQAMRNLQKLCYRQYLIYERLASDEDVESRETRQELVCHDEGVARVRTLNINGRPTGARAEDPWPAMEKGPDFARRKKEAAERSSRFQELIRAVPDAMIFTPAGQATVDGRATTVFDLKPDPNFRPSSRPVELLRHVVGRAWIDMKAVQMVRLTAVVESDFDMWGGLLLKVRKGARYEMRQVPAGDLWVPYFAEERWHARIALLKHAGQYQRTERTDFRGASALPK